MGDKYKVKKSMLKPLFASASMLMDGHYHELYAKLGWEKGKNGNYHCFNTSAHAGGDANPSLSVNNETGQWHCFGCGDKGNFQSYWKNHLKGTGTYGDSYTDFIIDFLGMNDSQLINFSPDDKSIQKNAEEVQKLYDMLMKRHQDKEGAVYIMAQELTELAKESSSLPMSMQEEAVERLLNDSERLLHLQTTRNLTAALVKQYKIGIDDQRRYVFPIIGFEGELLNQKVYNPFSANPAWKWVFPHKGYDVIPTPINNFTQQKLYFFEGEPDMYCAIAFGIHGAVTTGAAGNYDLLSSFGSDRCNQLFRGKEIVICYDADDAGRQFSKKLADLLYSYAKQIKILELDKSDINPNGLDPENVKEVTDDNGKVKRKRAEKDFTDFMRKNGFDEKAKRIFLALEEQTIVYTVNPERLRKERFKVTIQESRMPKYYSIDGNIELELTASVSDFDSNAFMYPSEISCKCMFMGSDAEESACKKCALLTKPGFKEKKELRFKIDTDTPDKESNNPLFIQVTPHEILGLINVTERQKIQNIKKIIGIKEHCSTVILQDARQEKLLHVKLVKDVSEYSGDTSSIESGNTEIDIEAYLKGDMDIYPNRTYKFSAMKTTTWDNHYTVLFLHKAEPVATSVDMFKMNQETYDILKIFQQKEGETLEQTFKRKYEVFGNAAGITGREDMFLAMELVYFSGVEIRNKKLLPGIKRGWVEVAIAGQPRCGKSVISRFLHNHYKIGEIISGSSAVTRSGLIGGMRRFGNKDSIVWGKIPMNDGGILTIDELSNIDLDTLNAMTNCRSEGVADVQLIKSGKAMARTRKLMLSNARAYTESDETDYSYGIDLLRKLCFKDEIIARFDYVDIVKTEDVNVKEFSASYDQITTEYTEFQSQNHIMWCHSRKPDDYIFEDGFEEYVNEAQLKMLSKFHPKTQLVNIEMRAKLIRLALSVAMLTVSIVPNNWDKVLIKKDHVRFVVDFLTRKYCGPNMKLDDYSNRTWKSESLGNMDFMSNILKFISLEPLLMTNEFSERAIGQIFFDYIQVVIKRAALMVDAKTDKTMTYIANYNDAMPKLMGVLISRNCLKRTKRGTYTKTHMFNQWIMERMAMGDDAPVSNILEIGKDKFGDKRHED